MFEEKALVHEQNTTKLITFENLYKLAIPVEDPHVGSYNYNDLTTDAVKLHSLSYELQGKYWEGDISTTLGLITLISVRSMLLFFSDYAPEDVICAKMDANMQKYEGVLTELERKRVVLGRKLTEVDFQTIINNFRMKSENLNLAKTQLKSRSRMLKCDSMPINVVQMRQREWLNRFGLDYIYLINYIRFSGKLVPQYYFEDDEFKDKYLMMLLMSELSEYTSAISELRYCKSENANDCRIKAMFELADIFISAINIMCINEINFEVAISGIPYERVLDSLNIKRKLSKLELLDNKISLPFWLEYMKMRWKRKRYEP